jgi:hypothetical protein
MDDHDQRVPIRPASGWTVHIEIEAPDKVAPLRPRMFRSYVYLHEKYGLPVLPIGLYLHFWELRTVHFQYLYVGLPALMR